MTTTYPVSLTLSDRKVLVVGGGRVATRRVEDLLETGARVEVVASTVSAEIAAWAGDGRLSVAQRPFEAGDVAGAWLCVAATDDPAANRAVVAAAEGEHCFVSAAGDGAASSARPMSVLRRGDLEVAVGTSGRAPARRRLDPSATRYGCGPGIRCAGRSRGRSQSRGRARAPIGRRRSIPAFSRASAPGAWTKPGRGCGRVFRRRRAEPPDGPAARAGAGDGPAPRTSPRRCVTSPAGSTWPRWRSCPPATAPRSTPAAPSSTPAWPTSSEFLAEQAGMRAADLSDHIYSYYDEAAVTHLFGVAAGVDSMILGEGEILGQVRGGPQGRRSRGHRPARAWPGCSATPSRSGSAPGPRPASAGGRCPSRRPPWPWPPSGSAPWSSAGSSCSAPARWARAWPGPWPAPAWPRSSSPGSGPRAGRRGGRPGRRPGRAPRPAARGAGGRRRGPHPRPAPPRWSSTGTGSRPPCSAASTGRSSSSTSPSPATSTPAWRDMPASRSSTWTTSRRSPSSRIDQRRREVARVRRIVAASWSGSRPSGRRPGGRPAGQRPCGPGARSSAWPSWSATARSSTGSTPRPSRRSRRSPGGSWPSCSTSRPCGSRSAAGSGRGQLYADALDALFDLEPTR